MITLCIHYTLDMWKEADFAEYARRLAEPIRRCGGTMTGYYQPTRMAGPTNVGLALIDFPNLAAYEKYREALKQDADGNAALEFLRKSGAVISEDRSILKRVG